MADSSFRKRSASFEPSDEDTEPEKDPDAELKVLIEHTRHAAWKSFQKWEEKYNQEALDSLCDSRDLPFEYGIIGDRIDPYDFGYPGDEEPGREAFSLVTNHRTNVRTLEAAVSVSYIRKKDKISAFPRYESCTPTTSNIAPRQYEDAEKDEAVPFTPYSDDPTFNFKSYLDHFWTLKWLEMSNRAPDCECTSA